MMLARVMHLKKMPSGTDRETTVGSDHSPRGIKAEDATARRILGGHGLMITRKSGQGRLDERLDSRSKACSSNQPNHVMRLMGRNGHTDYKSKRTLSERLQRPTTANTQLESVHLIVTGVKIQVALQGPPE